MSELDPAAAAWAEHQVGCRIETAVGLRDGGAPWLLTFADAGQPVPPAVLRVGEPEDLGVERTATVWAREHGIPAPHVLSDAPGDGMLLIAQIDGGSVIPVVAPIARLEAIGVIAARLHAAPPPPGLPRRMRSVNGVDFVSLWNAAEHPLRDRARSVVADLAPESAGDGFVHGDLWMGNVMWRGDELVSVIDWDCAGHGPAGVDLGSSRCDAATAFGVVASDHVLRGWEREAGRPADDLWRWDVVAALCTPPDMSWFTTAIQQQGRTDLTRELLVERRDAFLLRALEELGA